MKFSQRVVTHAKMLPVYALFALLGVAAGKITEGWQRLGPSDWMAFFGAMLGSVITIAGALFLVHWQADETKRRHKRTILTLINSAENLVARVEQIIADKAASQQAAAFELFALADAFRTLRSTSDRLAAEGAAFAWIATGLNIADGLEGDIHRWVGEGEAQWRNGAEHLLIVPRILLRESRSALAKD